MMEKGTRVADIRGNGDVVDGIFVTGDVVRMSDKNGNPYWSLTLADSTGSVDAKIWSQRGRLSPDTLEGHSFVHVHGCVNLFREKLQVRVDSIQVLDDAALAGLTLDEFLPPSPYDGSGAFEELMAIVEREVAGTPWKALVDAFFDEKGRRDFINSSAARSMHHAGRGGLAVHVLEICRICLSLADIYPDLDRPTLVCGALFHDIGKLEEMHTDPLEVTYTRPGNLMGHIVLGVARLEGLCEKVGLPVGLKEHLFHLILSHHGRIDYGAVKEPMSMEAVVLAEADMLSARLNTIRGLVDKVAPGEFAVGPKSSFFRGFATSAFVGQAQEGRRATDTPREASPAIPPAGTPAKSVEETVGSREPVEPGNGAPIDTGATMGATMGANMEVARDDVATDLPDDIKDGFNGGMSVEIPGEIPVEIPVEIPDEDGYAFKAMPASEFAGEFAGEFMDEPPVWEDGYLESLTGLETDRAQAGRKEPGPTVLGARTKTADPGQSGQPGQPAQGALRPRSLFDVQG